MACPAEPPQRLGIPRAHGSYEALLADGEVDAVYIPLPNDLHARWTIAAAEAGKHVLCEKPLAMIASQAEEMVSACEAAGVVLAEAFMYRHHPSWVRPRRWWPTGAIGQLQAVQSWFSYYNDDPDNIRNRVGNGGGAVMDIGCYCINSARLLFGEEPSSVQAVVRRDPAWGSTSGLGGARVPRRRSGELHVLDPGRARPARAHRRDHRPDRHRDPVQHPTRPRDPDPRDGWGDPPVAPDTRTISFPAWDQYTVQAERFARAVLDGAEVPRSHRPTPWRTCA